MAFALQWTFWIDIQPFAWFLFYPAVFLSAWIGGLLSGLVSTFFSVVLVWWFFIPPQFTFGAKTPMQLVSIGVFSCMGILFSILLNRLRIAIKQSEVSNSILAASEENLSVTLNSIGDAVMATDAEGKVTRLNRIAEQLTGWSQAEASGHPVADIFHIVHNKTRLPALIPVAAALAQGTVQSLVNDTVLIARNGSEYPIADSCAPIRNRDGGVIGAVLVFRDVTKEYADQEALRDSETRIRAILDTVADGIITINDRGIVETFNPSAERLFGYAAAEVVGRNICMLMGEPHRSNHDSYIEHFCATGETHVIGIGRDVAGLRKDGSSFLMSLSVTEMRVHDQRYFTGVVRDITERKQMEALLIQEKENAEAAYNTLRVSEERYRMLFDSMDEGFCVIEMLYDQNGKPVDYRFVEINRAFESQTGLQQALGKTMRELVPEHDEYWFEIYGKVARTGESIRFESPANAMHRYYDVFASRIGGEGSTRVGILFKDITERKHGEGLLLRAKEKAETANRAKDSFLATMSHEIRTPLAGMLGMLELLSLSQLDREQRSTLDTAWDSGRGLLRIVSDILDWSKIEEGKLELSPRPTSVAQLLQEVVNTYSRVASAKSLILLQRSDARLAPAHLVDPLRLSQVLNNFVSNAIKFTPHGEVELRAELLEQRERGERIRFSVKDTGIGIAKDIQERLFQRYQQESADTARMYGGTGLGLAICRCLAEIMDGVIELKSEQGLGSIFSIVLTLPVSDIPAETMRNQHPEVEQRAIKPLFTGGMEAPLVLAVDDHPTNRNLLARQLKMLGLRAETADNGETALSMWRNSHFALIITDCHMPEMDGYVLSQTIRKIETEEARPRTQIIAWTANALAEESGRCHAAGMDDLMVKPTDMTQLRNTLTKWLPSADTDSNQLSLPQRDGNNRDFPLPIDYSVLNRIVTDTAEQIQVLQDFQSHIRADQAKLLDMLGQDDPVNVERTAHRMKGSCQMVGARDLAKVCEDIEKAAKNGDVAGARALQMALNNAIRQLDSHFVETRMKGGSV